MMTDVSWYMQKDMQQLASSILPALSPKTGWPQNDTRRRHHGHIPRPLQLHRSTSIHGGSNNTTSGGRPVRRALRVTQNSQARSTAGRPHGRAREAEQLGPDFTLLKFRAFRTQKWWQVLMDLTVYTLHSVRHPSRRGLLWTLDCGEMFIDGCASRRH